ncbi:kynureninase [Agromyces endophyticus]|uniref:kynureninase n=1 Tax=Agromyces sp. H17E-10 TaxID=2932244 RepID=UPI001FD57006|nr:kynureninase [Agromyces sp. H17E-10]UOQ90469.1 kynureninase [Agromyces sp. H17E-10]
MTLATTPHTIDRATCADLDAADPLAALRERFDLPESVVYLDGNSLGALPRTTAAHVERVIREEWGTGLIRSWNDAGWFDKPRTLGDRIAPLIGAAAGEVVLGDSTSASLFQVAMAAARLRPGRRVIVSERGSFPTDLYILESVQELAGAAGAPLERRLIDGEDDLDAVLGDDVAVVVLTHVNYRTGRMYDLAEVTRRVHEAGALMVWDLCHSVGAVPVDLNGAGADFAIGCTYKYLNGGPGSPSFIWVAERHQADARPALTGWHGHARPFDFGIDYAPAEGITRFRVGTPQLLSVAGLEASLDVWDDVDLEALREKSLRLTELFISLVDARLGRFGVEVVTPRQSARRGSQVSLRFAGAARTGGSAGSSAGSSAGTSAGTSAGASDDTGVAAATTPSVLPETADGYAVMQAIIERGVIGDFRAPDLMRFGFTPLYVTHTDVWDAVAVLEDVLATESWRDERFARRGAVT